MDSIVESLRNYLEFEKRHYRDYMLVKRINPFKILYEQLLQCKRCELYKNIHNKVLGFGNHNARLMLIGEAPGENEDFKGKPFVGRAGEKLTGMLKYIGLKRDDVYISNVVKCRPPHNKDPEKEWIDACSDFLRMEIELVRPQFIMPLGRFASRWILNTQGTMASMRGKYYTKNNITIVPTYHPSSLLMQKGSKREEIRKRVAEDLRLLKSLMDGEKC